MSADIRGRFYDHRNMTSRNATCDVLDLPYHPNSSTDSPTKSNQKGTFLPVNHLALQTDSADMITGALLMKILLIELPLLL